MLLERVDLFLPKQENRVYEEIVLVVSSNPPLFVTLSSHKGCGIVVEAQGDVVEYPICLRFNSRYPQQLLPLSLSGIIVLQL